MAFDWNVFRIMADVSHTLSKCILIWAIHSNKSAEGVSLITQLLYLLVFCARYLFLPLWSAYDRSEFHKIWNLTLKMFYILSSAYIVFLMMRVYARTREREKAWKLGIGSFVGSALAAPVVMLVVKSKAVWGFPELSWIFSIILESTCILPQLLLLRQTTVPTVLDSFYLATLGSYRFFYVLNWLVRAIRDQDVDVVSVLFGLLQTALYIDFAWVYWTRQRVKLRGGAVVDSEDLGKSWLVRRFVNVGGAGSVGGLGRDGEDGDGADGDDDEEAVVYNDHEQRAQGRTGNVNGAAAAAAVGRGASRLGQKAGRTLGGVLGGSWRRSNNRSQGLSISADDGVDDIEAARREEDLAPPDEFEDDLDDDAAGVGAAAGKGVSGEAAAGTGKKENVDVMDDDEVSVGAGLVGNGSEWRDDGASR